MLLWSTLACWGLGPPQTPSGADSDAGHLADSASVVKWSRIQAHGSTSCGERLGGLVECWGVQGSRYDAREGPDDFWLNSTLCTVTGAGAECQSPGYEWVPDGEFIKVLSTLEAQCSLGVDGELECQEVGLSPTCDFDGAQFGGAYSTFDLDIYSVCGVDSGGQIECWSGCLEITPPAGTFTDVSVSAFDVCGLRADGALECWGSPEWSTLAQGGAFPSAPGPFTAIDVGGFTVCGLTESGELSCFGANWAGEATPPLGVRFSDFSVGDCHACGVTLDGEMECWGMDMDLYPGEGCLMSDQAVPPE